MQDARKVIGRGVKLAQNPANHEVSLRLKVKNHS